MLFALALIPVVALLIFIYIKDKQEKEPIGLLIGLFFAGVASIIPAVIPEFIGEFILEALFYYMPVLKMLIFAMCVVGPAEELSKFLVLCLLPGRISISTTATMLSSMRYSYPWASQP